MRTEYEATFFPVDKGDVRNRLKKTGAKLVRSEFLQKRYVFSLPKGHPTTKGAWVRVRDEGDKITMSLKTVTGSQIQDQKESMLLINDMEEARTFLSALGCEEKAYQETRRELWKLGAVEITIDEWPFIEPCVEIEGPDEESVKTASQKLGFAWAEAIFGAADILINKKYGVPFDVINNKTPRIVFNGDNPWINWKKRAPRGT